MDKQTVALVLGESLLLDGVGTSLRNRQDLCVVRLCASADDLLEYVRALAPGLVIFDLDTPHLSTVFSLLREHPGVPFFGIHIHCSEVLVLNSRRFRVQTMQDFDQLAQAEMEFLETPREGGRQPEKMSNRNFSKLG